MRRPNRIALWSLMAVCVSLLALCISLETWMGISPALCIAGLTVVAINDARYRKALMAAEHEAQMRPFREMFNGYEPGMRRGKR